MFFQDGGHARQEVEGGELLVCALVRPVTEQAELVTISEPVSSLLDGGVLEIRWERCLTGAGGVAGQNVASGES